MILAAGRGERMRPLTDTCPKPLLKVAGLPLIEHHISKLVAVGCENIVINIAWLGEQISDYLQDGRQFGANIEYSNEGSEPLDTAGGIMKALPLLVESPNAPFLVVNGDIYCDYNFDSLPTLNARQLAHIFLVNNPSHHKQGDFYLLGEQVTNTQPVSAHSSARRLTFSGIGLYRANFFHAEHLKQVSPLAPLLRQAAQQNQLAGSLLKGGWVDVGTPDRLTQLNHDLKKDQS
jgi:MurNAc alpha-1-phosphate uridylyltransferase